MTQEKSQIVSLPLWKKLLFSGVLLLIVLLVAEFSASAALKRFRGYDGDHLYQYEFDPYKNLLPTRNFADTRGIQHNAQGFRRSSNVSREKPEGTYRIFLMGASTAYGLGGLWSHIQRDYAVLDNSETIDAYLEEYLNEAFPGAEIEVINAAITSTWTHHHLIYLNQTILKFDPDMILFLDGYNDFYFFDKRHNQFASYSYNLPSRVIMGDPSISSLVYANGWWLFRWSAFAHLLSRGGRTLKRAITPRREQRPLDVERAMAGLEEVFPNNALKMHRRMGLILLDEGVTPVFMLQPMLILERDRAKMTEIERRLFEFNVESTRPNFEEFMRRAVDFVGAREREMTEEIGAEFLDLTGIYKDADAQIYTDYAHFTPHGNAVLARYIADHLIPIVAGELALQCDAEGGAECELTGQTAGTATAASSQR